MHPHGVFYKKDAEGMVLQTTYVHVETDIYYIWTHKDPQKHP